MFDLSGFFAEWLEAVPSTGILVATFVVIVAQALIATAIYNLFFHKLAKFPGPFLARSSLIWRIYQSQRGLYHLAIQEQHRKYGPVVRVSPNELSFASVESWKAIYGHRSGGAPTPIKSEFYDIYGAGFKSLCIGSERDPHKHGQMRSMLSAAFSTKSLRDQEYLISSAVDEFIMRLGEADFQAQGLNMTKWYEMIAFDSVGEMAFGQSFGSIKAGTPHSWSELIVEHLYFITLADNLRRLPLVVTLWRLLFPSTLAHQNQNSRYSRKKVEERLATKSTRNDFLSTVVRNYEDGKISKEEMTAHVSTLTIAGAETTATFLAATTYYLLKHPACLRQVQEEIRGKFSSYDEINATAARQLPYLQAVISEGLRIYAPGSGGFPRISTGMKVGDVYVPAGAEVFTHAWTLTHSEEYFADPMAFKPERWLDPMSTDVKEASQPFSMGPRGCLGQNFAYMEINLIMAKMFWKYDLELVDKELDWDKQSQLHVMWWKPELRVRFKERKRAS
ncbi:cytochrome P450 [Sphaerulina musiva SO2202]|uniref:Cytochrome P450 n=1 Tax=Sphaerulina musiva (strain SO2202) TaxID=692275 RepID=M3B2N4_SPHMS|nr:cytochrome P450 [Sphaerulina musiva SO2202]EMF14032.1 cytochrome P450 [Sphaerulina musiva SO2202]